MAPGRIAIGCLALVGLASVLLCLGLFLFMPRQAGAASLSAAYCDPVDPSCPEIPPYPTQVPYPYPTACVAAVSPAASPYCGVASVTVGTANGTQGLLVGILVANIFGFAFLFCVSFVAHFVRR